MKYTITCPNCGCGITTDRTDWDLECDSCFAVIEAEEVRRLIGIEQEKKEPREKESGPSGDERRRKEADERRANEEKAAREAKDAARREYEKNLRAEREAVKEKEREATMRRLEAVDRTKQKKQRTISCIVAVVIVLLIAVVLIAKLTGSIDTKNNQGADSENAFYASTDSSEALDSTTPPNITENDMFANLTSIEFEAINEANLRAALETVTEEDIVFWSCGDFNRDGVGDAFAVTGDPNAASNWVQDGVITYNDNTIWYIGGNDMPAATALLGGLYAGTPEIISFNGRGFLLWTELFIGGSRTPPGYIFGVDENGGYELDVSGVYNLGYFPALGYLIATGDNYETMMHTYDRFVMELDEEGRQFVKTEATIEYVENENYETEKIIVRHINPDGSGVCSCALNPYSEGGITGYRNYYSEGTQPLRDEYYSDGVLSHWTEYEYDDSGTFIRKRTYDADGAIIGTSTEMYDASEDRIDLVGTGSYTAEELAQMAQDYFERNNGWRPSACEAVENDNGTFTIHLYDIGEAGTVSAAWYTVDKYGAGTDDVSMTTVDLTK